jgi:hypothetical protein
VKPEQLPIEPAPGSAEPHDLGDGLARWMPILYEACGARREVGLWTVIAVLTSGAVVIWIIAAVLWQASL